MGDGREAGKRAAARRAAETFVSDGMVLGLGSGSTALAFVEALGARVRDGLGVTGVATSAATETAARAARVPLADLGDIVPRRPWPPLDLAVDGADEIDPAFRMIKGGGASLLREKILAQAARRMLVLVDEAKPVERLGAFPLPVEVVRFGVAATRARLERVLAEHIGRTVAVVLREGDDGPLVTDNGNLVLDCHCGAIEAPERLADAIGRIAGVVEHGLFLVEATAVLVGRADGGVELRERPRG